MELEYSCTCIWNRQLVEEAAAHTGCDRSSSGDRSRHWWTAQSSHAFDSCVDRNLGRNSCTEQTTMKDEVAGNGIIVQKKIDGGAIDLLRGV